MKYHSITRGFTLIETILYIGLLSGILTIVIPYAYTVSQRNLNLIHEINSTSD